MSSRTGLVVAALGLVAGVGIGLYGLDAARKAGEEAKALRLALEELESREARRQAEEAASEPLALDETPADPTLVAAAAVGASAEVVDMASLLEQMVEQMDDPNGGAGVMDSVRDGLPADFDDRMLKYSATMQTNMQYGAFFRESNLSPEQRTAAREILETYGYEDTRSLFGDAESGEGAPLDQEELEAWRDAALLEALGPGGFEEFLAYEETKEVRMLEESFDIQLRLFSSGLTPEVHDYVRDTLVAETLDGQQRMMEETTTGHFPMENIFPIDVLEARFEVELEPEDYRAIQPFLEQMRLMQESMAGFMNDSEASGS